MEWTQEDRLSYNIITTVPKVPKAFTERTSVWQLIVSYQMEYNVNILIIIVVKCCDHNNHYIMHTLLVTCQLPIWAKKEHSTITCLPVIIALIYVITTQLFPKQLGLCILCKTHAHYACMHIGLLYKFLS